MSVPVGLIDCGGEDDEVVVLGATIEGMVPDTELLESSTFKDGTEVAVDNGIVVLASVLAINRIGFELVPVAAAVTPEDVAVEIADSPVVGDDLFVATAIDDTIELATLVGVEVVPIPLIAVDVPEDAMVETAESAIVDGASVPVAVEDFVGLEMSEVPVAALAIPEDVVIDDESVLPVDVVDIGKLDIAAVSLAAFAVPDLSVDVADTPVVDDTSVPVAVEGTIELDRDSLPLPATAVPDVVVETADPPIVDDASVAVEDNSELILVSPSLAALTVPDDADVEVADVSVVSDV